MQSPTSCTAAVAFLADGIEHAVVGEQVDEPLHVHDVALGRVVARRTMVSASVVTVISALRFRSLLTTGHSASLSISVSSS
jgi:hypothetical protein